MRLSIATHAPRSRLGAGKTEETAAESCKAILHNNPSSTTGKYYLKTGDSPAFVAYCDMTLQGGGWTLVMKANNGDQKTFYSQKDGSPLETGTVINSAASTDMSRADTVAPAFSRVKSVEMMVYDVLSASLAVGIVPCLASWHAVVAGSLASLAAAAPPALHLCAPANSSTSAAPP